VEALVALMILAFALLGMAMLFPLEARLGALSKITSQTGVMAQKELDQVRSNAFATSGSFVDADGNTDQVACSGPPATSCGSPLNASGSIDFNAAPAVGYSAQIYEAQIVYNSQSSRQQYSVRWNITVTSNYAKQITLACQAVNPPSGLAPIVQYQTIVAH
jgi:hypothetical protein